MRMLSLLIICWCGLIFVCTQGKVLSPLLVGQKVRGVSLPTSSCPPQASKSHLASRLALIRGGATKKPKPVPGPKPKTLAAKVKDTLDQVKPATRVYLLLALFCSVVHITGLPAPAMFSLDASKLLEIWRPLTAIAYLGAPSMSMANSLYFLLRYGQTLEESNGTAAHVWFLLLQTGMLTALGLLLGFPFQAQAMIAATVYVCSRVSPMDKIPIQFGIVVTAWQLPYCMMIIDCLSQQSPAAAWPHVLGIFTGHMYHFFFKVWPALGGRNWLATPQWLVEKLGGSPGSNIPGMDFRKKSKDKKPSPSKLFAVKKGRKLG